MVIYWGIEYLRKTLLCLVVIIYPDFIAAQMMILYLTSTALIIAAGYFKARNSSYDRKMDIFQEAKLIVIMYHLMLFTMFVPDLDTRQKVDYSCFVVILLGIAMSMVKLIVVPVTNCKKKTKICCAKLKLKSRRKEFKSTV